MMNPSTAQAHVVVDELIRHGIRDAVVCPGSRSAPLALALAAAEREERLRLHVRIDERTAGFLALGLALGSRLPVPVLVTSGTAVANLHPAMVEAAMSGIPILAITANRPPELQGSGSNQTIDQQGIFGVHARANIALGTAGNANAEHHYWRTGIGRAILISTDGHDPGPVQIDIPFRAPLVPDQIDAETIDQTVHSQIPEGRPDGRPWLHRPGTSTGSGPADSAAAIDLTRPTLVIAGAGAGPVAELVGVPTVAEPGAPVPLHPVHPLAVPALAPEQVIVLGRPTLHRSVTALLDDPSIDLVVLASGPRFPDPTGHAAEIADRVLSGWGTDPEWIATTHRADTTARAAVAHALAAGTNRADAVDLNTTGLHVAHVVAESTRPGDHLICGASNPIRDLSYVGPLDPDVTVHANRGASGIDGTLSTAIGIAHTVPGRAIALVGDLTFLHDLAALTPIPGEQQPDLTIVVADDNGGGIFSLLEQGEPRFAVDFERVFGTPHGADIETLCAGYHVPCHTANLHTLAELLDTEHHQGLRVIRVPTNRAVLQELHQAIRAHLKSSATESETQAPALKDQP